MPKEFGSVELNIILSSGVSVYYYNFTLFFRLIQPEEKPKSGIFHWGSTRFRYHGRTQFQTKMASQMFDHTQSGIIRNNGNRLSQSCDNGCWFYLIFKLISICSKQRECCQLRKIVYSGTRWTANISTHQFL